MPKNDDQNKETQHVTAPGETAAEPAKNNHKFLPEDPMLANPGSAKPQDPEVDNNQKSSESQELAKAPKPELRLEPSKKIITGAAGAKTVATSLPPAKNLDATEEDDQPLIKSKPNAENQDLARAKILDQLAEEKTYFLPISNTISRNWVKQFIITFVVVVAIGLAVFYFLK